MPGTIHAGTICDHIIFVMDGNIHPGLIKLKKEAAPKKSIRVKQ